MRRLSCVALTVLFMAVGGHAGAYQADRTKNVRSLGHEHLDQWTHRTYVHDGHLFAGVSAEGGIGFEVLRLGRDEPLEQIATYPCSGNPEGSITGWKHFVFQSIEAPLQVNDPNPLDPSCGATEGGIRVVDVSDPLRPRTAGFIDLICGSHNVTPFPYRGDLLLYNTNGCSTESELTGSTGQGGVLNTAATMEVIKFDPERPSRSEVRGRHPLGGMAGCHDLTVYEPRNLAACVGTGRSALLDVSDPYNPKAYEAFETGDLGGGFAQFTWDGRYLLINEIPAKAAVYGEGCFEDRRVTTGVHIWDIEDVTNPVEVGMLLPDREYPGWEPGETDYRCHASKFTVVPMKDERRYIAVTAWGSAGVSVFDFSDPTAPREIAHWHPGQASVSWWAIWYNGRVFLTENLAHEDAPATNSPLVQCAVPVGGGDCEPFGSNVRALSVRGLGPKHTRSYKSSLTTQWQSRSDLRP